MAHFESRVPFVKHVLRLAGLARLIVARVIDKMTTRPPVRCMSCNRVFAADDPAGPAEYHTQSELLFCLDCNVMHFGNEDE